MAGFGIIVLYLNLDGAARQLGHLLGTARGDALGVLPAAVLVAARVMQAYNSSHRRFLEGFFEHLLVLLWPLLLVIVGRALSKGGFADKVEALMSISRSAVRRISSSPVQAGGKPGS